jgi:ribosome assembly protein 1
VVGGRDREKVEKIVNSLNLKVSNRDLRSTDPKQQLSAIFSQWLPVAPALLKMVCKKLPSPTELSDEHAEKLMCSRSVSFSDLENV